VPGEAAEKHARCRGDQADREHQQEGQRGDARQVGEGARASCPRGLPGRVGGQMLSVECRTRPASPSKRVVHAAR